VDTLRLLRAAHVTSTPLCSSSSTFLPVRAHLPFVPLRPPRLIFVGVTDRLLELQDLQKRSAGDADGVDFWALAPVCGPSRQRTFGRRDDPALGFASCRVVGHVAVHRPGSTPLPITSPRFAGEQFIRRRRFLSAHGLPRRFLPITPERGSPGELPPGTFECDCEVLSLREFVAALQRLDGADALFDLLRTTRPAQADSLSEVLHRP
jgi:hypothetical protein